MKWEIAEKKYDDVILQILFNRGIISLQSNLIDAKKFLDPKFDVDLFDPLLLPDYLKIEEKIIEAKSNKIKVGIFADYDADGIPGAALLYKALDRLDIKSEIYIPNRESGYGLSEEGIDYLISKGCEIIITVDLGIRNFSEAKYAKDKKVCLIITDHHEPDTELPCAYSVTNPKIKNSRYPFRELSGAGVVFKIIQGLSKKYPKELSESFIKWNLDLVAISTISDVVPLISENRIIAKYGLSVLKKTKNIGIRELCAASEIDLSKMNAYSVGFGVGPRINAPGRIDHATKSFRLLTSTDKEEVKKLAVELNQTNEKRQEEMKKLETAAQKMIEKNKLFENNGIVVVGDWHKGVLGPSASHMAEKYFRPTIILSDRSEPFVGSARSISGVDLVKILTSCENDLERFGGHKGAAGLSIKKSNFKKFVIHFCEICNKLNKSLFIKKIAVDYLMEQKHITLGLIRRIEELEPFGMGNKKPVFMLANIKVTDIRRIGKDKNHLSFRAIIGGKKIKAIYFNSADELSEKINYDMIFALEEDTWNGNHYIQLNIIDLNEHGKKR